MSTELEILKNKAYKTAKARFNAADRLKAKQKSLVYFITFLTLAQIAVSVALLKIDDNPYAVLAACLSISFSVFIALISNSNSVSKDVLHAHLLHKCGMDLMRLHDKMCVDASLNAEAIKQYVAEYSNIINDCSINHDTIDFKVVECQIAKKGWWVRLYYSVIAFFKTYRMTLIYIIFSTMLCYVSYFLFMPKM